MAIYRLTTGDDSISGTAGNDRFDGYSDDDGLGATGGTDLLNGGGGNDVFLIGGSLRPLRGQIDGGTGTDTVFAYGSSIRILSFRNVEVLSVEFYECTAGILQLNAFSTITTSVSARSTISFEMRGAGGTIDFSGKMAPGKSVSFDGQALTSGFEATGTGLDDVFYGSLHDDTVDLGAGNDVYIARNYDDLIGGEGTAFSGGNDTVFGGTGADRFEIRGQSGLFDGGAGFDTVNSGPQSGSGNTRGHLGDATFVNVERLLVGEGPTVASIEQLNAFSVITGGDDGTIRLDAGSAAGGTIDFSTKLRQAEERVIFYGGAAGSALYVTGTANSDSLTGSAFDDRLAGGDGQDILVGAYFDDGAQGRDVLIGGAGSDLYYVDPTDTVVETMAGPEGGRDGVYSFGSFDLASARVQGAVEILTLAEINEGAIDWRAFGNALDNALIGNSGDNVLDGRAGADQMSGARGDDTYYVDEAGDRVFEGFGEGTDRVFSSVDFDLAAGDQDLSQVENLVLTGNAPIDGFGNELDNRLTGNAAANTLDGREGSDVMVGRDGNDTYRVDAIGDRAIESAGEGIDRVFASVSYRLGNQEVERLTLTGSGATNGIGNALDNDIVGNSGNNVLSGGLGNDRLTGGDGADAFLFNTAPSADNADRITDFDVPSDTIRLDDAVFTALTERGRLSADAFAWTSGGEALDAEDRVIYESGTGNLYYDADGTGSGAKVLFATVRANLAILTEADFLVV